MRVLEECRKAQTKVHEIAGSLWRDYGLVLTRDDGTPIRPAYLPRFVQAAALKAGVEPIGVHGLRHTWATLALESGLHAEVVQERRGHSSIATALDINSHVVPEMDQDAATKRWRISSTIGRAPSDPGTTSPTLPHNIFHPARKPQAVDLGFSVS